MHYAKAAQYLLTVFLHMPGEASACCNSREPPAAAACIACLSTSRDHSSLGRPTVRTEPSVAALRDPG